MSFFFRVWSGDAVSIGSQNCRVAFYCLLKVQYESKLSDRVCEVCEITKKKMQKVKEMFLSLEVTTAGAASKVRYQILRVSQFP